MTRTSSSLLGVPLIGLSVLLVVAATPTVAQGVPAARPQTQAGTTSVEQMQQQRLAQLHQKLGITPAEEGAWSQFAQASTQNATQLDAQYRDRAAQLGSMNAVQTMQSFAKIQTKQAEDMTNLVPQFQQLYAALSPAQQQAADAMFRDTAERASTRKMTRR